MLIARIQLSPIYNPIIEGVDLLYHEATSLNVTPHVRREPSTLPPAKRPRLAYKAQVKRLVIGHYSARYEDMAPLKKEADKIFPGTILGEEGMRLSV